MDVRDNPTCWLLQLPDECLVTVLRCCADDLHSLCSAAQTHSRMRQAALVAGSSISIVLMHQQQQDNVVDYLWQHGEHIDSLHLEGRKQGPRQEDRWRWLTLEELPHHNLQGLSSLSLGDIGLQLQPAHGFLGVLGPGIPLKKLLLKDCGLLDQGQLVTALSLLPNLQHLSLAKISDNRIYVSLPSNLLKGLQQLTFLELAHVQLDEPEDPQHLQGPTRLQDLRLCLETHSIQASMLSSLQHVTHLRLTCCRLTDAEGLVASLSLLPQLQHLGLESLRSDSGVALSLPSNLSRGLQKLTYLELAQIGLQDPGGLQHLQGPTRLQHLRLVRIKERPTRASLLSGLQHLTHHEVLGDVEFVDDERRIHQFEPDCLAGKTLLQHLRVKDCSIAGGSAGTLQLLSNLQHLQHLTYLGLGAALCSLELDDASAAAYSSLTASTKLQHLDISSWRLQEGVLPHVFSDDRQLPHLRTLRIDNVLHPTGPAVAPEGSRLVSCCPGLQSLDMWLLQYSPELLYPLSGLSALHELSLQPAGGSKQVSEDMLDPSMDDRLLLQLAQLRQLTRLVCGSTGYPDTSVYRVYKGVPGQRPVWHQLLLPLLTDSDREVAQQATAALVDSAGRLSQ